MPQEYIVELVTAKVASEDRPYEEGIITEDGVTLPFTVERGWSGPSGNYQEQWSIRKSPREIVYSSELKLISVRGPQSVSRYTDRVDTPIELDEGTYLLAFVVEGRFMGSKQVEVKAKNKVAAPA